MALCPNGHDSASDDFCDVCGMRIGGRPATGPSAAASAPSLPDPDYLAQPAAAASCPRCGTPRTGQFCEACGFNFSGPRFIPGQPPAFRPGQPSAFRPLRPRRRDRQLQLGPAATARRILPVTPRGLSSTLRPRRAFSRVCPFGSARPHGLALAVDVLVPVPAGHLDRGGGLRTAPTTSGCRRSPGRKAPP